MPPSNSLPLYKSIPLDYKGHAFRPSRFQSYFNLVSRYIRTIIADPRTRNVFFFLLLNLSFAMVEAVYGLWTNSLGLCSDAVHMLFDSSAIICGLIASVISKWEANERYTYG